MGSWSITSSRGQSTPGEHPASILPQEPSTHKAKIRGEHHHGKEAVAGLVVMMERYKAQRSHYLLKLPSAAWLYPDKARRYITNQHRISRRKERGCYGFKKSQVSQVCRFVWEKSSSGESLGAGGPPPRSTKSHGGDGNLEPDQLKHQCPPGMLKGLPTNFAPAFLTLPGWRGADFQ